MKLVNVDQLFNVKYGVNLDLNKLEIVEEGQGIRYVGRTEKNNGITAWVRPIEDKKPNPAMTISVAGGGSVLSTFVQETTYYSGRDLFYLEPKKEMTINELMYYATVLKKNKFKFSYGRQANRTLPTLKIPCRTEIPKEIINYKFDTCKGMKEYGILFEKLKPLAHKYKTKTPSVNVEQLFNLINGINAANYVVQPERKSDNKLIPVVRPSKWQSTSYAGYVDPKSIPKEKIFPAGTLYVGTNGAGSHTYAYVSIEPFTFNSDVTVLIPKKAMTLEEKLVYATLITANRFKFSYGRKPKGNRLKLIILPKQE